MNTCTCVSIIVCIPFSLSLSASLSLPNNVHTHAWKCCNVHVQQGTLCETNMHQLHELTDKRWQKGVRLYRFSYKINDYDTMVTVNNKRDREDKRGEGTGQ